METPKNLLREYDCSSPNDCLHQSEIYHFSMWMPILVVNSNYITNDFKTAIIINTNIPTDNLNPRPKGEIIPCGNWRASAFRYMVAATTSCKTVILCEIVHTWLPNSHHLGAIWHFIPSAHCLIFVQIYFYLVLLHI